MEFVPDMTNLKPNTAKHSSYIINNNNATIFYIAMTLATLTLGLLVYMCYRSMQNAIQEMRDEYKRLANDYNNLIQMYNPRPVKNIPLPISQVQNFEH